MFILRANLALSLLISDRILYQSSLLMAVILFFIILL